MFNYARFFLYGVSFQILMITTLVQVLLLHHLDEFSFNFIIFAVTCGPSASIYWKTWKMGGNLGFKNTRLLIAFTIGFFLMLFLAPLMDQQSWENLSNVLRYVSFLYLNGLAIYEGYNLYRKE